MMGPKLQSRFNRDIPKTRIELDRMVGRITRLGNQDLFDEVAAEVATLNAALGSVSAALEALEARVTTESESDSEASTEVLEPTTVEA